MPVKSCYVSWAIAKTGENIPCFEGNKPAASLYNPQKEAEIFSLQAKDGFIVIAGFTSGLHIAKIIKKYPNAKIIVAEANEKTLDFLQNEKKLEIPSNIILCTPNSLYNVLLAHYYPPLWGDFCFLSVRSWADANPVAFEKIRQTVKNALEAIASDISVQAHFGKIWHRNILQNLSICESLKVDQSIDFFNTEFPVKKTAFIAGAGPGLELWFDKLQKNRKDYYIIATDTAHHALSQENIISDIVFSVDAQHISSEHFLCKNYNNTVFAFDLCANSTAVRFLASENKRILFFNGAHPLGKLVDKWYKNYHKKTEISAREYDFFPYIESSGGTVTLAALHFARQAGFKTIKTGGADFAYINGKMYANGTYLDSIFNASANRLTTAESFFTAMLFKNDLIKLNAESVTTTLLQKYKKSFDDFFSCIYNNSTAKNQNFYKLSSYKNNFPTKHFIAWYRNEIQNYLRGKEKTMNEDVLTSLLPLATWHFHKHGKKLKPEEIFDLGVKTTVQI
ncbi:MAG: 6-hydroxymethylpterin diphosphokinase MptE-like protein [Spirochaetales bacterium]